MQDRVPRSRTQDQFVMCFIFSTIASMQSYLRQDPNSSAMKSKSGIPHVTTVTFVAAIAGYLGFQAGLMSCHEHSMAYILLRNTCIHQHQKEPPIGCNKTDYQNQGLFHCPSAPPCPAVGTCDKCITKKEWIGYENSTEPFPQKSRFPDSVKEIAVGMSRVPRTEFGKAFDTGVPLEVSSENNKEVLIIYNHHDSQPDQIKYPTQTQGKVPLITNVYEATANCDYLYIILSRHDRNKQCVAIMGQSEAHHIQKFMRLPPDGGGLNSTTPLRLAGRLVRRNGQTLSSGLSSSSHTLQHWERLRQYFDSVGSVLKKLRPLAAETAKSNALVIMFSNQGQSELIINFCCSAHARNLDLSSLLVFATDLETKSLLNGLGVAAFYDEQIFGHLPSLASEAFGDKTFDDMMHAKVFCIQLGILMGYDILFQDADMVWFQNPLPYFQNKSLSGEYDIMIADDGNRADF